MGSCKLQLSPSILLPKTSSRCKVDACQGGDEIHCSSNKVTFCTSTSADDQYVAVNLKSKTDSAPVVSTNPEFLSVTQKISCFQPNSESNSLLSILHGRSTTTHEFCKKKLLSGIGMVHNLCSIYGWMSEIALVKPPGKVNALGIKYRGSSDCYVGNSSSSPAGGCMSTSTTGTNSLVFLNFDCNVEAALTVGSLLSEDGHFDFNASKFSSCLEIATLPVPLRLKLIIVRFLLRDLMQTCKSQVVMLVKKVKRNPGADVSIVTNMKKNYQRGLSDVELCLSAKEKPHYALAKQEHAFAGALAGIFVSICLHPMDTIKTVLQSCRVDQKPFHHIGRSIISERGVMGLYRGISSNIASSAPISAVYTFTYESVKSNLVPFFPKEYQSFAHCVAGGGCASIATSFIFTPPELLECLDRDYPERWFVFIVSWMGHCTLQKHSTHRHQVCGGLAASTAVLFTTPFDVVKTRYKAQIPGSINKYDGLYNTLKEIAKCEGLKGLYRGLTPRLAMYMSQGALFFASYESFKRLFSLEVPQLSPLPIQHE